MATHIALHEVGVPFELKLTALTRNEHRAAEYLAVNPEGKVPTLMIDGRPLTEVAGTLWYLARRYPEAGRDPKSLSLRLGGAPDDADRLKRFRDIGVDAVNMTLMSETRDQLLPILDHWAGHIRQLNA